MEPRITTADSWCKPDLVVWNNERAVVLDVAVCSDQADPNTDHHNKVRKYAITNPEVAPFVKNLTGKDPEFSAFVSNWRGILAPESANDMLKFGLRKRDLAILSVSVVELGTVIHRQFQQTTSRAHHAARR